MLHRLQMSLSTFAMLGMLIMLSGPAQATSDQYHLGPGDKVRVTVFGDDQLSGEFQVDANGAIAMPLIGEVDARGRTTTELATTVTEKLSKDYLKDPKVSVEVIDYRPFYILGEVRNPGSYPFVNGMRVMNAVALAGGFTYRAREGHMKINRDIDGQVQELEADQTTVVLPGDVIEVPERFF
ncbi:MAG: polysaccharide biosynthesis/export family protein [Hypericibacter sp.]